MYNIKIRSKLNILKHQLIQYIYIKIMSNLNILIYQLIYYIYQNQESFKYTKTSAHVLYQNQE